MILKRKMFVDQMRKLIVMLFSTPPEEPIVKDDVPECYQIKVKGVQTSKENHKINFSEFEALSDPFADLELKTINDLAELQTILTSNNVPSSNNAPCYPNATTVSNNHLTNGSTQNNLPHSFASSSHNPITDQYFHPSSTSVLYSNAPGHLPSHFNHYSAP